MGWVVSVKLRPRFAPGKWSPVPIVQEVWWASEVRGKILCLCRGSNFDRPVVQSVLRHYTDWATSSPECGGRVVNIPASCSGGSEFKSRLGELLSSLRCFVVEVWKLLHCICATMFYIYERKSCTTCLPTAKKEICATNNANAVELQR
jgi:hypothetical protein